MTEGSGQAPAGWYNDPHAPERMRYFDGEAWTNHFHDPGRLPDIGSWLGTTFSVFGAHWPGAVAVAFGTTFVGNVVLWMAIRALVNDLAIVEEELVGFSGAKALAGVGLVFLGLLWQGFGWLALNRYMQRAHFQASPSVGDAFTRAARRLPKYVAVVLGLIGVFILVTVVLVALFVAAPVVGALVLLALLGVGVWVLVKLAFLNAAIAAAPAETSVLRASAEVSTGRFWPVFGRLVMVTVVLALGGNILASVLGRFGSAIDPSALADTFVVQGDEFVVRDFRFVDLFASNGVLVFALFITSVIRAAIGLISTSAFMRLYLDAGAPSEL